MDIPIIESPEIRKLKERIGILEQTVLGLLEVMKRHGIGVTLNVPIEGEFKGQINTSFDKLTTGAMAPQR
jgi:hypothetical protein